MNNTRHHSRIFYLFLVPMLILPLLLIIAAGCGSNEDTTKEKTPEYVQAEIYCGRNIPGGGEVTEEQFAQFLTGVVTPEFPLGMTVYDAYGQMEDPDGNIVKQRTKVILLVFEKSGMGDESVRKIIDAYKEMSGGAQIMKTISSIEPEFFPSGM